MTTPWQETLIHLPALAARLVGAGQCNAAHERTHGAAARRVRRRVEYRP